MFICSVKTPRDVEVNFGVPTPSKQNHISLLTGPNGSGKTEALTTIVQVFHGDPKAKNVGRVVWANHSRIASSTGPLDKNDDDFEPIRLVAQTFSPFSRFPAARRHTPRNWTPERALGDEGAHSYTTIGFNKNSRIRLDQLSFSIISKAVLRLSDRPSTAKVAFDVLHELNFKDGIAFTYLASKQLAALVSVVDVPNALEQILDDFSQTGFFKVGETDYGNSVLRKLLSDIRRAEPNEIAEYLRHAIHMAGTFFLEDKWINGMRLPTYRFVAFEEKNRMSSDFSFLQAFSLLTRLQLIKVVGCELTPIGLPNVDLTNSSSGQQQMLCTIFGLAAALENGAVVVIDEPELSLHPRWQMNFFRYLESALEFFEGCHIIIATHSPLIAQAAAEHDVQIISLEAKTPNQNQTVTVKDNPNSVEKMLVEIFETPIPSSLHVSKEVFKLVSKAESGSASDQQKSLAELARYLALYQRQGEGSNEMKRLLEKAIELVAEATPSIG